MTTTAADFALEAFLPYRLSVVTNHASRLFARRYSAAHGLSVPEWRVLAVVGRFGGLSATGVVERTAMDKVKVSRAVRALLDRGLLARQEDAADRRVQRLAMTAAGRALHAAIVPEAKALEAELLAALAPAERQALHAPARPAGGEAAGHGGGRRGPPGRIDAGLNGAAGARPLASSGCAGHRLRPDGGLPIPGAPKELHRCCVARCPSRCLLPLAALAQPGRPTQANDPSFRVVNNTAKVINEVYASPANQAELGA